MTNRFDRVANGKGIVGAACAVIIATSLVACSREADDAAVVRLAIQGADSRDVTAATTLPARGVGWTKRRLASAPPARSFAMWW